LKISIDVGYSQVKAIAENGRRVLFPSVQASVTKDPTVGMFKSEIGHRVEILSLPNPRKELVGDAALRSLTATSTLSRKKSSDMHDLFILTAAYLCGASGITQLAVGLPLAFYRFQKDELKSRLESLTAHMQVNDGPKKHIAISTASVYPQGAGVLLSNGLNITKEGKIGLIDIGYYTTDFLMFEVINGMPNPIAELCGSIDTGIHLVSKSLSNVYQEETGSLAPKFLLNDIIANKPIQFEGRRLNIRMDTIYERVAQQIMQEVSSVWGKQTELIDQTILAGGGTLMLKRYLSFPNLVTPSDPVFANAEGFLYMISSKTQSEKAK
jgi:plasmid segregation protein ParM